MSVVVNLRLIVVLFGSYTLLFLLIIYLMRRVKLSNNQAKHAHVQLTQLEAYIDRLETQYQDVQNFKHDYNNILVTLTFYIRDRDLDNLQHYFETKILPTAHQLRQYDDQFGILSNLKIPAIKGLLSSKIIQAQTLGIKTIVEIPGAIEDLPIHSITLSRILGIILDNAIEESQQCEEKVLHIGILKKGTAYLIIVKNSCRDSLPNTSISSLFEAGMSTKGEHRGRGLANLREMIDKTTNATLATEIKAQQFVQKISVL